MKNFYFTLILLFIGFFISAQTTPTGNSAEVGVTSGELSVSNTGTANYKIPIAVPVGINGVEPQISLIYNSQGGNGACWLWLEYRRCFYYYTNSINQIS